ncbi:MAG: hypothetical protein EBU85_02260 [Actinobacteria bacterium]|nr:hypothetical protein [Actinomycetota bacterium]
MSASETDHGSTPAAWTAVIIMLVGMTISGFALWFAHVSLFWAGIAVCGVGAVVGKVMQSLGFGQKSRAELVGSDT